MPDVVSGARCEARSADSVACVLAGSACGLGSCCEDGIHRVSVVCGCVGGCEEAEVPPRQESRPRRAVVSGICILSCFCFFLFVVWQLFNRCSGELAGEIEDTSI